MGAYKIIRRFFLCGGAVLFLLAVRGASTPPQDKAQNQDAELQIGQEVFKELKAKGEIVESSPLYDQLKPIADSIT